MPPYYLILALSTFHIFKGTATKKRIAIRQGRQQVETSHKKMKELRKMPMIGHVKDFVF